MNYDYAKIAKEVIQAVGGSENIKSAAHCATRLRLIVADRSLADDEKVGEIDAVKGTFFTAGQYQIIFGTGHVNRVYEQIIQLGIAETTASEAKEAKMDGKNQVQKAIRTFGDVFVPVIPALVATGLFLGLKGALLNDNFLSLFGMTNSDIPHTFVAAQNFCHNFSFFLSQIFGKYFPILEREKGCDYPSHPSLFGFRFPCSSITRYLPVFGTLFGITSINSSSEHPKTSHIRSICSTFRLTVISLYHSLIVFALIPVSSANFF